MLSILRDALKLDIWDMNYANVNTFPALLADGGEFHLPKGILTRLGGFFYHFISSIRFIGHRSRCKGSDAIIFFVTSQNQTASLSPLLPYVQNPCWYKDRKQVKEGDPFPAFWAHFVSLFFIPVLLYQFWRGRKSHDIRFQCRYGLDRYLLTYGYYVVARLWLRREKPQALVVANDTIIYLRTMAHAAKDERIITFYLQHASITERFPPLMFDYALLDGVDALETYGRIGESETTVYLIGMPKFDKSYQSINTNSATTSVGVCVNMLDSIERVEELCVALDNAHPGLDKYLRPHPRETRTDQWKALGDRYGLILSDPKEEDSFSFLKKIDVLLAGNSSIHVEAALLNVYPILYVFSDMEAMSMYGFQELCDHISVPQEACEKLTELAEHKPNIRARAIPYCATINTAFDGCSSELAGALIEAVVSGQSIEEGPWERVPTYSGTAYQLRRKKRQDTA